MTNKRFWWKCKHLETDRNLGVAFCGKTNNFCNKSKCNEMESKSQKHNQFYRERIKELEKENDELKQQNKMLRTNIEKLTGDVKYLQTLPSEHRELYKQSEAKRVNLLKENEQLKQQIRDLYKFVKCDVDNEIDVYPKSILGHLVNILKIIGDV